MQLLETIKCKYGKLYNLSFHQERFKRARQNLFPASEPISLANSIQVPPQAQQGLFRCRVLYSQSIERIEFLPHQIRKIESLKLVEHNEIDYSYKFSNRKELERLYQQRGKCDDILIVKNGFITDSFTANPVFYDGHDWWAPETTLLEGTQRARLISEGKLKICPITVENLYSYQKVGLINALQDMDDMPVISTANIL